MKNISTFGFYKTKEAANNAISILKQIGIKNNDISVLYPDHKHKEFTAHDRRQAKNGAYIGAIIGFFIFGGISFWMTLQFLQLDKIPQEAEASASYIVLKGILIGILIGASCGALIGIGIPKSAAIRFGDYVGRSGGILVSVHLEEPQDAQKITDIFEKTGANDIKSMNEASTWQTAIKEKNSVTPETSSFE